MSIKVCELAKELGVTSEDVLDQLRRLYVEAEGPDSMIDDKISGLVRIKLVVSGTAKKPPKEEKKAKTSAFSKPKTGKAAKKVKAEAGKKAAKAEEKIEGKEKEKAKKPKTKEAKAVSAKAPEIVKPAATGVKRGAKPISVIRKTGKIEKPVVVKKAKKGAKVRPVVEIIEKGARPGFRPKPARKAGKARPTAKKPVLLKPGQAAARKTPQKVQVHLPINLRNLAPRINLKPSVIMQYLMGKGVFANINQDLEEDVVREIMEHFGYELELPRTVEVMEKELVAEHREEEKAALERRAPVVTFMGHVDHGKTSLLDYIRKTMVTKGEKGGITQHIGAYKVETPGGSVTFLDTPGHAAFTAMRARGANVTDVVVLVVAADDGVMPQTREAIDHARAADVPIVVAINKCDLPGANPDRVKTGLQQEGLAPEEWGGKTVMVEVSAHTGEGVDHLVEMLTLESELLELKANPKLRARGVVVESRKTPDKGIVITVLVQNGTLRTGDIVLCDSFYGKVKAMIDDMGRHVGEAHPATPVEIMGLQGVPEAGEEFFVVKDEKKARTLALLKQQESKRKGMAGRVKVTLEDLYSRIAAGAMKELKIILKADVQGSVEALKHSLEDLSTDEVKVNMIHSAVGNINESDTMLAMASNAVVIGFHIKVEPKAEEIARSEGIDVHVYDVIYEAIADVKAGMEGLLEPEEREVFQGSAQVREVFSTRAGKVAGCAVVKGTIHRNDRVRVKRDQETVFEGNIDSLKRFKEDVKEVREGFECGISIKGFNDIRKNDVIEAFTIEKVARRLEK